MLMSQLSKADKLEGAGISSHSTVMGTGKKPAKVGGVESVRVICALQLSADGSELSSSLTVNVTSKVSEQSGAFAAALASTVSKGNLI